MAAIPFDAASRQAEHRRKLALASTIRQRVRIKDHVEFLKHVSLAIS